MSREIDLSKPLSDEDRQYLVDRARNEDLYTNEELTTDNSPDRLPSQAAQVSDVAPQMRPMAVGAVNTEDADRYAKQAGAADNSDEAKQAEVGNYSDPEVWDDNEIKAEVQQRQEEYEDTDKISVDAPRADLVAWLEADDRGEHDA